MCRLKSNLKSNRTESQEQQAKPSNNPPKLSQTKPNLPKTKPNPAKFPSKLDQY